MQFQRTHQFHRTLTLLPLIILGLAYMSPMTVFSTYGVVVEATHGMIPMAYLVALAAMLFTAISYGKMVNAYPVAGSAYSYTEKSISPYLGFVVGWSVLMDYLFMPMINILLAAIFLSEIFSMVPMWSWVLIFDFLLTVINLLGIRTTVQVNTVLIMLQIIVTILFVILSIYGVGKNMGIGALLSTLPFNNPRGDFSCVLAGASILCLSFLGFDAVTTLAEETVNPRTNVPRAIFFVALCGGVLFTLVSYFAQLVYPNYTAFKNVDAAAFEIAKHIGGLLFSSIFLAGMVASVLASGIASQASTARLLFAMGRNSLLPKCFAFIHPRLQTPVFNIFVIAMFSLLALLMDLTTAASFINFGALIAFTFVNLSVIFHYYIKEKKRNLIGIFHYLLMPLIGACFVIWLWSNLNMHALELGGIWIAIGFIYLLFITKFFSRKLPEFHLEEEK